MDYDSTPLNVTFTAGSTSTIVNVPVIKDDIAEQIESFNLIFIIPPSLKDQIIPGNITKADVIIIDTTGKKIAYVGLLNSTVVTIYNNTVK